MEYKLFYENKNYLLYSDNCYVWIIISYDIKNFWNNEIATKKNYFKNYYDISMTKKNKKKEEKEAGKEETLFRIT